MKRALIVVDMQKDFVTGALGTAQAQAIVPLVRRRVEEALAAGSLVLFTKDTHTENYGDTQEGKRLPVPHCIRGTEGWELVDELNGLAAQVLEKPSFGAPALLPLVEDADVIELIGVCTDICVISNALLLKAHFPEKTIQVDQSCCAGTSPELHRHALQVMQSCQVDIVGDAEAVEEKKRVTVQTFGKFAVFVDGKPVKFSRRKAEELFAFLIDRRGAGVTNAEIAAVLFEDKEYNRSVKNQVQTMISQMIKNLREYQAEDVIIRQWNSLAVDSSKIECDYYDFMEHKEKSARAYLGEYMVNYSWAEDTNGYLMRFL